jgi:hypothetical protein
MTTKIFTNAQMIAVLAGAGLLGVGCVGAEYGGGPGGTPTDPIVTPGDDDDDIGDDDDALTFDTGLTGVVRDAWGAPIEGVTVSTSNGYVGESDRDGRFAFEVEANPNVVVSFLKDGYARSYLPFEIMDGVENAVLQTMAEVDLVETFDASVGMDTTAIDGAGATFDLPADNFVDADGAAYSGMVTVEATFYDLTSEMDDGLEIFAAPGDFTAIDAMGDAQRLESWGMVQVNLWGEDGEELNLGGETSSLRIPLQIQDAANASMPEGTTVPAWSFDTDTGKWVEEGEGTLVEDNGVWYWEFEAPHFSSWNCDQPMPSHGCITGIVTNSQGVPRVGATARAVGLTYTSTTTARTGQDGSFCIEVKNGETVWVEISYTIAGQPATQRTDPVTTGTQATCTDGNNADCVDLGTLPIDIMTCVSGLVIDSQGNPVANADVVSPQGGIAQTDADGGFCLAVPVFATTEVFVLTGQDEAGYQPTRMFAQAGLPGCQNGCPNLAILRPYTQTTCAQGEVIINSQAAQMIPVEAFDLNFPEVAVFSTTTQNDGSYCLEVPVTSSDVMVRVGNEDNPCGEETISTSSMGGEVCDDDPNNQGPECAQVPTFTCTL